MRALLLIFLFLVLRLADTFTTWSLTSSGRAVELNPTVNTESLLSLFLLSQYWSGLYFWGVFSTPNEILKTSKQLSKKESFLPVPSTFRSIISFY